MLPNYFFIWRYLKKPPLSICSGCIRIQNNCRTNRGPYIVLESKNQRFQGQGKGYQRKERRGKKETREGKGKEVRRERERKGKKERKRERKGREEERKEGNKREPSPYIVLESLPLPSKDKGWRIK